MFVVIVGSRGWYGEAAIKQVNDLLDELKQKYSGMVVVTSSSDRGVGHIVRERCLKDKTSFEFVDLHMRVYATLSRTKLSQVFYSRNAALSEIGEEFHICIDHDRRGAFEDLIERLDKMEMKRPVTLHLPNWEEKVAEEQKNG